MKKRMAAVAVGAALLAGVFVGSVIGSPSAVAQGADEAPNQNTERVCDGEGHAHDFRDLARAHRRLHQGAGALSEILGLEQGELRDALADGTTIAELAAEAGLTVQDVVDAMIAEASERLDAAVADGRIDADDAAEKLAEIEERATARVNGEMDLEQRREQRHERGSGFRRSGPPAGAPGNGATS
jgi:hypothetical protein